MGFTTRFRGMGLMRGKVLAAVALAACAGLMTGHLPAHAQGKDLSDKSINTLMDYAWAITPAKFTLPSGKEIVVDLKNRAAAMVPIENAREVVRVGRLSANAQICGLREEQGANYQTLMARETAKAKWTDQQLLYINQLHLLTVMMLTGRVSVVAREGEDKQVVVEDNSKEEPPKPPSCSDTERAKVAEQIKSYLAAEPAVAEKK